MASRKKAGDENATSKNTSLRHEAYTGMLAEHGLLSRPKPLATSPAEFYDGMNLYMTCWLELCRHYQIDLPDDDADFKLAQALAVAHVPAFQTWCPITDAGNNFLPKAHRPSKLPTESDVVGFLDELARCDQKLKRSKAKQPSQRALIAELKKSKFIRDRRISDSTIKAYLAQMKVSSKASGASPPTEFQRLLARTASALFSEADKK